MYDQLAGGRLTWSTEHGLGYFPVQAGVTPYDAEYFDRFGRQADTDIGRALMDQREKLVRAFYSAELVDVGIGSGAFVTLRNARGLPTYGYDVNPAGVAWLQERGLFWDPYAPCVGAITLWDVMEHIPDFDRLLANVTHSVFVSIPIFRDAEHVAASKHFRPDEHVWYFTRAALVAVMARLGFECMAGGLDFETKVGREDIESFVFRRRRPAHG